MIEEIPAISYHTPVAEAVGDLRVLALFQRSLHLQDEQSRILTVTTAPYDGPLAVRVAHLPRADTLLGLSGRIHHEVITVGSARFTLRGARQWNPPLPVDPAPIDWLTLSHHLDALTSQAGEAERGGLPPRLLLDTANKLDELGSSTLVIRGHTALHALAVALDHGERNATAAAVSALVGLGPGLTPSGDDVLCGVLAGLVVFGARCPELAKRCRHRQSIVREAAALYSSRTTLLSRTLLEGAGQGVALQPLLTVLWAVGTGSVAPDAEDLLAVGHSSGSDMLTGASLAAGVVQRWRENGSALAGA